MPKIEIETEWNIYYPKVYGYFFRRLESRSDVEDLTAMVLEKFLNALLDPIKLIQNPNAYLWRIAHNELVNFFKQKSDMPPPLPWSDNLDILDESLELHRSSHFQAKITDLMQCVKNNLTGIDYKIVELCVMQDQKAVDVGKDLNLKPDNVRQKLSRGLKKLKQKCTDLWYLHN